MLRAVFALGLVGALALMALAGSAGGSIPRAVLRVGVPRSGDVSVAQVVLQVQGARVARRLHPRVRVLNRAKLGSGVVVVAGITQLGKSRRFDLTTAVIHRGGMTVSGAGGASDSSASAVDALLLVDEPDLRVEKPAVRLVAAKTVVSVNVVQGNALPSYPLDCGAAAASYLSGDQSGLSAALPTLLYSCGLALDQDWMPLSYASAIGAPWCAGLIGPATTAPTTYPAGFACNFTLSAFAVQDPEKSIGVTGLSLSPPLAGSCQAPFQQPYIGICSLTNPLPANTAGGFTLTLASPLPSTGEFGLTALSGSTQRNDPMRSIDLAAATNLLTRLITKYPDLSLFADAKAALTNGRLAEVCYRLLEHLDYEDLFGHREAFAHDIYQVVKALECTPR